MKDTVDAIFTIPAPAASYFALPVDERVRLLQNVPAYLRKEKIWVGTKLTGSNAKAPLKLNGRLASHSNPETWSTFDETIAALKDGVFDAIGCVLEERLKTILGDLDGTNIPNSPYWIKHQQLLSQCRDFSYTELSCSFKGYHIFAGDCEGLPNHKGRRSNMHSVEIYTHRRFVICTGITHPEYARRVGNDAQGVLRGEAARFPVGDTPKLEMPDDFNDPRSTDEIIAKIREQENFGNIAEIFDRGYPAACDKSQEDARLAEAICFVTKDTRKCREIFCSRPGWTHERALEKSQHRRDYVGLTFDFAYSKQAQQREVLREEMAVKVSVILKGASLPTKTTDITPPIDSGVL